MFSDSKSPAAAAAVVTVLSVCVVGFAFNGLDGGTRFWMDAVVVLLLLLLLFVLIRFLVGSRLSFFGNDFTAKTLPLFELKRAEPVAFATD